MISAPVESEYIFSTCFYMYILLLGLLHRYIPASVNHSQAAPCGGAFMLQQVCYACVTVRVVCDDNLLFGHTGNSKKIYNYFKL